MEVKNSSLKKIQVMVIISVFIFLFVFSVDQRMNGSNYYENHYEFELLEISTEYIGTTYKNYTVLEGYELYRVEKLIKNNSSFNRWANYVGSWKDGIDVTSDALQDRSVSTISDYLQSVINRMGRDAIPAGMQGKVMSILEIPKGTTQTVYYDDTQEERKEITITLEK